MWAINCICGSAFSGLKLLDSLKLNESLVILKQVKTWDLKQVYNKHINLFVYLGFLWLSIIIRSITISRSIQAA
jgi:hypothetical protein